MKTIEIKTQEELDGLPDDVSGEIYIVGEIDHIVKPYPNAIVRVSDNGQVGYVYGNGQVRDVSGNGQVGSVYDNGQVGYVSGNGQVGYVYGNGQVGDVSGNGQVGSVYDNGQVKIYSSSAQVDSASGNTVIICQDCSPKIIKKTKSVTVVKTKQAKYDIKEFAVIYGSKNGFMILYKSVQPNNTDFYTGKIKYEGTVECPDWNPDKNIQCGYGLHLSPTPELTQRYNVGKVLKCKVALKDIVVHPSDISKVRCRRVEVIEEVNP
jgi:DNA-directed RNA polymerase subunit RPC12/RpoP